MSNTGREFNPKLDIPFTEISPTFHNFHYAGGGYPVIRAKLRLDAGPVRELLRRKQAHYTLDQLAWRSGVTERTIRRIVHKENDVVHIDTVDKICIGFDTSIRELYGE